MRLISSCINYMLKKLSTAVSYLLFLDALYVINVLPVYSDQTGFGYWYLGSAHFESHLGNQLSLCFPLFSAVCLKETAVIALPNRL
jgi:hypothetical protein